MLSISIYTHLRPALAGGSLPSFLGNGLVVKIDSADYGYHGCYAIDQLVNRIAYRTGAYIHMFAKRSAMINTCIDNYPSSIFTVFAMPLQQLQ